MQFMAGNAFTDRKLVLVDAHKLINDHRISINNDRPFWSNKTYCFLSPCRCIGGAVQEHDYRAPEDLADLPIGPAVRGSSSESHDCVHCNTTMLGTSIQYLFYGSKLSQCVIGLVSIFPIFINQGITWCPILLCNILNITKYGLNKLLSGLQNQNNVNKTQLIIILIFGIIGVLVQLCVLFNAKQQTRTDCWIASVSFDCQTVRIQC